MRRTIWAVLAALVMSCGGGDGGPGDDPYAVIWIRNQLSDSMASDTFYKVLVVRVNQDSLASYTQDINQGEQGCQSFAGFADDSLDIQIWLAAYNASDTLKSMTFMPLTGPTDTEPALWGVFFTDTGVVVMENPPGTPCTEF